MEDKFDKKINKTLTEIPTPSKEILGTIWANLENRIDFDNKVVKELNTLKNSENKFLSRKFITKLATGIAAVALVALSLTSTPAKAMINEIINFFGYNNSQDYYTVQNGSTRVDAEIFESSLGYITYYDNKYFDVTKTDYMDRFVPKTDNGKGSSQSFLELKLLKNTTVQEAVDTVSKEYKQHHSDVQVIDNSDKLNNSYLLNPLEGIVIKGYDFDTSKKPKVFLKNDSFYEFCSIAELEGIGTISISYKYKVGDEDTSLRIEKLYRDIIFINENTIKYMEDGPNLLVFDYDHSKYKLIKIRGEQYSYLSPATATTFDPGILSVGHFYNKNLEKAAEECLSLMKGLEIKPTNISLKSVMLESKENIKIYLIEDGQGGVFELDFNIASNEDTEKIIKSLRIVPQKGNEELMKPEEVEPYAVG